MVDGPNTAHVTPYDRLALRDVDVERLLAAGERRDELIAWFGPQLYAELAPLARRAQAARSRGRGHVFLLPGIMGSQLGVPRPAGWPADILWLDPIDIALGRLRELVHRPRSPVRAYGVLLFSYLKLKLRLRIAGYSVEFFDYDWRLGLEELGRLLGARIAASPHGAPFIVAHSMGGLVARSALSLAGSAAVRGLVMLGVPHSGSFAPVQALRGTYSVVRKVATLDLRHSAETLASEVFSTFPSLYDLLPAEGRVRLDLFDAAQWPARGPAPDRERLAAARSTHRALAPGDARMTTIVGHGKETVTDIARVGEEFEYTVTREGDGTVPTAFAELAGARNYYVREAHSDLPRSNLVIDAVIDVLRMGLTTRLRTAPPPRRRARARVRDAELRRTFRHKVEWRDLSAEQRRVFLETLNEPPHLRLSLPAPPPRAQVTRGRTALEVILSRSDVVAAPAEGIAVAIFQGVRPAGAAGAVDARLDGAIESLVGHRILSGDAGRITALPTGGRLPHAGTVLLVGLGRFDRLSESSVEVAAEHAARFAAHARIATLATVPWGAGAGLPAVASLRAQLRGFLRGRIARKGPTELQFCVRDPREYREVAAAAPRIADELAAVAAVTIREAPRPRRARVAASPAPRTTYLLVEHEATLADSETWRTALLTTGREAAVVSERVAFARSRLEAALAPLEGDSFTASMAARLGARLADLLIHPAIRHALAGVRDEPLVVVHDDEAGRVPWESLTLGRTSPALTAGLSRRYAAANLPVARFSERRREDRALSALLVVDPTEDLPGAEREGERIRQLFRALPDARLTIVAARAATRARLAAEIGSGDYDLVHYAGHAFFDPARPGESGLRASDGVLASRDLGDLGQLPSLVVFNACESGRIRGRTRDSALTRRAATAHGQGLAEALLRAGLANYVGTFWPVGDAAATAFAEALYAKVLAGASLGDALLAGRRAIRAQRTPDWAGYLHYGDPFFRLKVNPARADAL